jgi:hypothetical protein
VRQRQPILLLSAAASLLTLTTSLTHLVTSDATAPGLRVRDEYVASLQVSLLTTVYFAADALLRALAFAVLALALDTRLPTALLGLLATILGAELLRVACRAGCLSMCAVLISVQRSVEIAVRALVPILAPATLTPATPSQRRIAFLLTTSGATGLTLLGMNGAYDLVPLTDPHARLVVYTALSAAVATKYLAFAACVFPAMTDDAYGVLGVLGNTKEAGRVAVVTAGVRTSDALPPPLSLPQPSAPQQTGVTQRLASSCSSHLHLALVVLTCGLYGRQPDGSYFGASYYEPLSETTTLPAGDQVRIEVYAAEMYAA